ncbi:MAG: hypothetical protein NC299_14690 [Lachnospiraceae bacterium]|nr:hypothetical protein [Ruminococcus sp.]MCM1276584.1 hypothetical protein [Lachnospiraceae bacterium]
MSEFEFILSEYVREFYRENGIELTDRDRAAIVLHESRTFSDTLECLEKIAAETDDGELKEQIACYVAYERTVLEKFRDNSDRSCVYQVISGGRLFAETPIFFDYEEMLDKLWQLVPLLLQGDVTVRKVKAGRTVYDVQGVLHLDRELHIMNLWTTELGYRCPSELYSHKIPFASPFAVGDFVRFGSMIGVVEKISEENDELWSEFATDRDTIQPLNIHPIFLENVPLNERGMPECFVGTAQEQTLCAMSAYLKGKGLLNDFLLIYSRWKDRGFLALMGFDELQRTDETEE